jgi:predicted ArsR family transcriptional regulator
VSLPERRYDLASRVMVEAIAAAQSDGTPVVETLGVAAKAYGTTLGGRGTDVTQVLADNGYEPRTGDDGIVLTNCPFGGLAETHTALVCGMNLDLIDGVLRGLPSTVDAQARLAPAPGRCCVVVTTG